MRRGRRPPNVLLEGEAGTGKSLVAGLLARLGRPREPLVVVPCGSLPACQLAPVLFGVEEDATGDARVRSFGAWQSALGGTLLIEEVWGLPIPVQIMLLDELRQRHGDREGPALDRWIISTSNIDVLEAIRHHRLLEDLYRRLATVHIGMPPLRECERDVLLLAKRLLPRICAQTQRAPMTLATEAGKLLLAYTWPGNVRELTHMLTRAVLLTAGSVIAAEALDLPH
jgi:two-component system response regulator AtoC